MPRFPRLPDHRRFEAKPREPQQDPHEPHQDPREPEQGPRESEYLHKLSQSQTPVEVRLRSGETFRGYIEYYDKRFIRLTRQGEPNVFIFKDDIKYLSEE